MQPSAAMGFDECVNCRSAPGGGSPNILLGRHAKIPPVAGRTLYSGRICAMLRRHDWGCPRGAMALAEQLGGQRETDQGKQELDRPQFPHRSTFRDLVDSIHCPAERADISRRRPHRTQDADDQREPADGDSTSCWIGMRRVSTADAGPSWPTICNIASVVRWPWPNTPSRETTTTSAGNSDNTA
jgi:hypothetical protein